MVGIIFRRNKNKVKNTHPEEKNLFLFIALKLFSLNLQSLNAQHKQLRMLVDRLLLVQQDLWAAFIEPNEAKAKCYF